MKAPFWFALVACAILTGCGGSSDSKPAQTTNAASSGNPLSAPADYLGALGNAKQKAVKTVDTTSLDKAIELFNADKGRNPKDLQELVTEKYYPKIPDAPYGTKLDYNPTSGKVTVVPK